jgi:tRNA threonylcarbamoyl adenosine modification protein YjeE
MRRRSRFFEGCSLCELAFFFICRYHAGMHNSPETVAQLLATWNKAHTDAAADPAAGAFVVGLSGHLGAGKTSFTKLLAKELSIAETVTSPTFVIMKIYEIPTDAAGASGTFKRLVHIDAYRLERRSELEGIDFERIASDPGNLVIVEWPENAGLTKEDMDEWLKLSIQEGAYIISK